MLKITTRQEAKESGRRGRKKNSQKKLLLLARVTPAPFGFCFLSSCASTIGRRPRDRLNRSYDDGMRVHWASFRWLKATGRRDLFFFSKSTLAERRASEASLIWRSLAEPSGWKDEEHEQPAASTILFRGRERETRDVHRESWAEQRYTKVRGMRQRVPILPHFLPLVVLFLSCEPAR